jgi:uncharacterized Zn-finger protein
MRFVYSCQNTSYEGIIRVSAYIPQHFITSSLYVSITSMLQLPFESFGLHITALLSPQSTSCWRLLLLEKDSCLIWFWVLYTNVEQEQQKH